MRLESQDLLERVGTAIGETRRDIDQQLLAHGEAQAHAMQRLAELEEQIAATTKREVDAALAAVSLSFREVAIEGRELTLHLKQEAERLLAGFDLGDSGELAEQLAQLSARFDASEASLNGQIDIAITRALSQAIEVVQLDMREAVIEAREVIATLRGQAETLLGAVSLRLDELKDGQDGAPGADGAPGVPGPVGPPGPRGEAGPAGRDGVTPQYLSTWDPELEYRTGDHVNWDGSYWVARRKTAAGEEPGKSDAFQILGARGKAGAPGPKGDRGPPGADGPPGPRGDRGSPAAALIEASLVGRKAVFADSDGGVVELDLTDLVRQLAQEVQEAVEAAMARRAP